MSLQGSLLTLLRNITKLPLDIESHGASEETNSRSASTQPELSLIRVSPV